MSMYKLVGSDGQQYGPVTEQVVRDWIAVNRANGQTLAQAEGSTEWKPLASFPEFAQDLAGQATPDTAPPLPPPPPLVDPEALAAEILARDYQVEIGSCLSRGWDLVTKHFWLLVGASFVVGLIMGAVPFLAGACMGGLYLLSLKLIRGHRAEFGDAFAGFSLAFLQLFLAGLVQGALLTIGFALCLVPGIYLAVAWTFTFALVIDKKMDFWPAMELSRKVVNKHWWVLFGLILVGALANLVGLAVCCVGVYVSQPVIIAALAFAYEDIFGAKHPPSA
jgi:hypothetical protein